MLAEIITIGDEILIGQVVDTNSAWIAEQLNLIGIKVKQISSVSDDEHHILKALDEAAERADLILITGGLGPTKDDLTKNTLCNYFNTKLVLNEDILAHIEKIFKTRNLPMLESNIKQAELPENCTIIPNKKGTAAGMWFTKNNKHYISMPGVPFEMKAMVVDSIIPMLKEKFKLPVILHRTILTFGMGESFLAKKIEEWENNLPENIKLAYLPSPEHMRLRMSIFGSNESEMQKTLDVEEKKLQSIIGDIIFGFDKDTLPVVIGNLLKERGMTLSTAESCTGGAIAAAITSIPGSSAYFKGSVVAYSNQVKENILHVNPKDLTSYGAVSEQVVIQMAKSCIKLFDTDFAIATSGIAGPDGGTEEKPVGTVWIAVASKEKAIAEKFVFGNDRNINIRRSTGMAMNQLRKLLLKKL